MDNRFSLLATIEEVVIPQNYHHATVLDTNRLVHGQEYDYYHPELTDHNFYHPSVELVAGQVWDVDMWVVSVEEGVKVSSEDCVKKLQSVNAALVGAQGLVILSQQKRQKLPRNRVYLSYDEKERLPFLYGKDRRIPSLSVNSFGDFNLQLNLWEDRVDNYCRLLAFHLRR